MHTQEETRQIVANGAIVDGDNEFPVAIQVEYSKYHVEPVRYKLVPDMPRVRPFLDSMTIHPGRSIIRGQAEDGKTIIIKPRWKLGTSWIGGSGYSIQDPKQIVFTGEADEFVEGDLDVVDCDDGTVIYKLFINSPVLATPSHYVNYGDTGEIKKERELIPKALSWQTPFGVAQLVLQFNFKTDISLGHSNGLLRIERPCIMLEAKHSGTLNLVQLLDECKDYFDDVLWFISFLSRERVVWFEGEITYYHNSKSGHVRRLYIRRDKFLGHPNTQKAYPPVITTRLLSDGLMDELISNYMKSELRSSIHQTIVGILITFERVYLENAYTSIYTALEGIVAELVERKKESKLFEKSRFSKIREKIEHALKDEITQKELEERPSLLEDLYKKISELNRRSFADQLSLLLDSQGIELGRIFPNGSNVNEELKRLRKRRNDYIHTGKMVDSLAYSRDIGHLRYLLELWILHLLLGSHERVEALNIRQPQSW